MSHSSPKTVSEPIPTTNDILASVVTALETATGDDMETMPLVSDAVNVDAMCRLLEDDPTGDTEVHFDYQDHHVVVSTDEVEVQ